ncbi:hypothetical protein B9Z19DRAFT_1123322 [Tuber borchii]|uniref:Uncharacterized protein n=1 Tax=Tuber borchii TaxID=42251 RepID=A0A2T6ZYP6_TUBBO|nr:hypothetical protein B9Z19DRAFT_1123322 [Tuber borchii]
MAAGIISALSWPASVLVVGGIALALNQRSAARTADLEASIKEDIRRSDRRIGKKLQETQEITRMGILLLAKHEDEPASLIARPLWLNAFIERVRSEGHGF